MTDFFQIPDHTVERFSIAEILHRHTDLQVKKRELVKAPIMTNVTLTWTSLVLIKSTTTPARSNVPKIRAKNPWEMVFLFE